MNWIYHRIYLAGYSGWIMPRTIRRAIGGTECHRAWILGHHGYFEERRIRYGPTNPYNDLTNEAHL